jgi:ribonuclease D
MLFGNLPAPVLVTRPSALKQLVDTLSREPIVAVDTESNSLYVYREQVCLIQFSTRQLDYLVDPLALKDLSMLGPVFSNPKIEKVFHAAEYDVICLKRDFGFRFSNLFDTMLASRILGREAFGLGAILEEEFGVHLEKRFQRADWGQRPLPTYLQAYARLDTHFLIPLRERLYEELVGKELWPLAAEDFYRMSVLNGRSLEERPLDCWRVSGAFDLAPQKAAVLLELCRYRDKVARTINRPVFKVINDQTLVEIAQATPQGLNELMQVRGMSKRQVDRHGMALLAAVRRGLQGRPVQPPRSPRPDEQFLERLEALRRWRKGAAEKMGVKSDVVLPRDLMYALAESDPCSREDLEEAMGEAPWRLEHFGEQILEVLGRRASP